MTIVMKVLIEQDEFIYKAIITALESRKGFKHNDSDVCEIKEITKFTVEGNKNVH